MKPLLSVIIPTIGREGLEATLRSIACQPEAEDTEGILVADTHSPDLPLGRIKTLCRQFGRRYRYVEHDGGLHCYGQPQRNRGAELARGRWLTWMADDDIYTHRAFAVIVHAIAEQHEPCPMLFRVETPAGWIVWDRPELAQGHIDAECLVTPNEPGKVGHFTNRYEGDYDAIRETVDLWDGRVQWRPEVIAIARPNRDQDWTRHVKPPVAVGA